MGGLEHHRFTVFAGLILQARVGKGGEIFMEVGLVVDLVKGQPVLHFVLIAGKHYLREADKEINEFTVAPAAVFSHQVVRHLKMGERDHRFDTIFQALVEQIVIELQARFIGLQLITQRKNARPGN